MSYKWLHSHYLNLAHDHGKQQCNIFTYSDRVSEMWILRVGFISKWFMVDFIKMFEMGKVTALLFLLHVIYNNVEVETNLFG